MAVDMKNALSRAGKIPQEVKHDLGYIAKRIEDLADALVSDDLPMDTIVRRFKHEAAELKIMAGMTSAGLPLPVVPKSEDAAGN